MHDQLLNQEVARLHRAESLRARRVRVHEAEPTQEAHRAHAVLELAALVRAAVVRAALWHPRAVAR
jgi:hypothetical protein